MALESMTRSPFVPLTLKSGSKTPHEASCRDIAAVPTAWNVLHPINDVRGFAEETIQRLDVRRRMIPCILGDLFIRFRRSQALPRIDNKPSPGFSGDKSFSNFDGSNHRFDVKVGGQEIGINDGRIERVRGP